MAKEHLIWSKQIKPLPQPLEPLFAQVAAEGYAMVEWRSPTQKGTTIPETDLISQAQKGAEIRKLSASYGIEMAYHAPQGEGWDFGILPFGRAVDQLKTCVSRAVSIGAQYLTLHLGIALGEARKQAIWQGGDVVMAVLPDAEKAGICLCVENVFENCSVATVSDCQLLFDHIQTDQVKLTLDTGHGHLCHCLPDLVKAFPERLAFVHIHDNDGIKDRHWVPGRGNIDWKHIIADLHDAQYMGPINFELREDATLTQLKKHWFAQYSKRVP